MSGAEIARAERAALADLFAQVGPDAPTLCAGWSTRDLAAHLVVREARPDAAAGLVVPPLAGWTERVQRGAATRPYAELVDGVRSGPPAWSYFRLPGVESATNVIEYFVHHEDVRRARPDWAARQLDDAASAALWSRIAATGKFFVRKSPVGVVVAPTDGPAAGTELEIKGGERSVTLRGPVGEIVLAIYGRVTQGLVIEGEEADVEAFRSFGR